MGYNYRALTGSTKISARNQGGGSKLAGLASTTNITAWTAVAYKSRGVLCPCNRNVIFCMNQVGGIGASIPGNSYMFAPGAGGVQKTAQCGKPYVPYTGFDQSNRMFGFSSVPVKYYA